MRSLQLLLPFLAWISLGLAQSSGLAAAVAQLSPCAQKCLGAAIKESSCTATNVTCICTNAPLQSNVETCLLSTCTLRESLTTKNVTATTCHAPVRDKSETSRVANLVLSVISVACGLTRIVYKAIYSMAELGWDDYTIILTLLAGVPSVVLIDRGALPNGLGRDVWTVPFDRITAFVRWLYVLEILYFFQMTLLKLTLLFFFLRIFPKTIIRNLLKGTVVFTMFYGLTFVIVAVFQCQPINHYWTNWDKEHEDGQCINVNALAWSNAIVSIILDIWMLVLPLYEVFRLQLSWRKKISVAVMFLVGTFVTVVSCLRLQSLVTFAASSNPTWDQVEVVNWSNIEVNVGIICACLPTIRVILVRFFPNIMGTTKVSSQAYHAKYGYGNGSRGLGNTAGSKVGQMSGRRGVNEITYTKTFEVQHADNDEVELMHMDEFGKTSPKPRSSNASVASL
ncbi:hypothetical protein BU25DRAFT_452307 [Macroventuria anomochaeta]|uniref:Uncharacterized protein n=1 Tax=Macroventuria anomochaeta TaxID=301207 RepID=A0ACB6RL51_9PLEO|nr:uncharacterized protein BU25DRAFT_452307 [Macroventuria anomochaeta]KAF2622047.1 hypothetical protein BU25DRAFT_452307 [Macroventuria anomochaeta]